MYKLKRKAMDGQQYCLRWNNHQTNLLSVFEQLLHNESFTDVTLACDGTSIKCHKMVLAACSSYFESLFMENSCHHPIVFLKDIKYVELKAILEYIYRGEVNVAQDQLGTLLRVAEALKVKGLVNDQGLTTGALTAPANSSHVQLHSPHMSSTAIPPSTSMQCSPHTESSAQSPQTSPYPTNYIKPSQVDTGSLPIPPWPASQGVPMSHSPILPVNRYKVSLPLPLSAPKTVPRVKTDTPILRTALGHGHSEGSLDLSSHSNNSTLKSVINNNSCNGPILDMESSVLQANEDRLLTPVCMDKKFSLSTSNIATYVPTQKPEWKRYKQYTPTDVTSAINAVKHGMSPLRASREYGVPSRTLYDKVKKLGIATSRHHRRGAFPMNLKMESGHHDDGMGSPEDDSHGMALSSGEEHNESNNGSDEALNLHLHKPGHYHQEEGNIVGGLSPPSPHCHSYLNESHDGDDENEKDHKIDETDQMDEPQRKILKIEPDRIDEPQQKILKIEVSRGEQDVK